MATIARELKVLQGGYGTRLPLNVLPTLFSMHSLMPWPVLAIPLFCCPCIIAYSLINSNFLLWKTDLAVGLLILLIVLLNMSLIIWMQFQRKKEIICRIEFVIDLLLDVQYNDYKNEYAALLENANKVSSLNLPSHSFSTVYLKDKDAIISFPTTLLQTGDIIELHSGQVSPCQVTCSYDGCLSLNRGEIFTRDKFNDEHKQSTASEQHFRRFDVVHSPICEELSDCFKNSLEISTLFNRPKSMLIKNREKTIHSFIYGAMPVICILTLTVITSWFLLNPCMAGNLGDMTFSFFLEYESTHFWFDLYVISLTLILLPVLPIMAPFLWITLHLVGEAKVLVRCLQPTDKAVYEYKSKTGLVSPTVHSLDEVLSSSGNMSGQSGWFTLLLKLLKGDKSLNLLNSGVFDSLGSITALCCIDKEGILSWYDPMPEKIGFLSKFENMMQKDDQITEIEKDNSTEQPFAEKPQADDSEESVKLEVMNISHDPDNLKLQFDDPGWQNHINSLKPIGLNILLTYLVNFENKIMSPTSDCEHMFARGLIEEIKRSSYQNFEKYGFHKRMLSEQHKQLHAIASELECYLSDTDRLAYGLQSLCRLIGFADDATFLYLPQMIVTGYKKTVSYVARKKPSSCLQSTVEIASDEFSLEYIHAVVVTSWIDKENHYLMSIGTGDLLTSLCSHYWDGSVVKILDETLRKKILDFSHRNAITGSCVSFAFLPVPSSFVKPDSSLVMVDQEDSLIPSNQIFVGMVALQHQPRVDVIRLIEALDGGSIRFVHFTPEHEFKARVFAERMGLEVGWNCHISLTPNSSNQQEAHNTVHTENDEFEEDQAMTALLCNSPQTPLSESSFSDSAFHQQNRAKLPRGIENIIPHIEQVDNVPLLVPLFTDSDQKCMREMISIMQHYGEVVCCIGSSECIDNIQVFTQADVSIALQPSTSQHVRNTPLQCFSLQESFTFPSQLSFCHAQQSLSMDDTDLANLRIMKLARRLNTFPCAVTLSGENSISMLYSMIKQARHTLFLSTICLIFLIKAQTMVALIQFLTHLINLPRIFTPLDVAWLTFIVTPLLSSAVGFVLSIMSDAMSVKQSVIKYANLLLPALGAWQNHLMLFIHFSLLASPLDSDLMTWASLKNMSKQSTKWGEVVTNVKRFATKFLPSCVLVVMLYLFSLLSICDQLNQRILKNNGGANSSNAGNIQCYPCFQITLNTTVFNTSKSEMQRYVFDQRLISQQLCLCGFVFYLCVISSGYVHRWKSILHRSPFANKVWSIATVAILLFQAIYSSLILTVHTIAGSDFPFFLSHKVTVFVLLFTWPLPLLFINEVAKTREIKVWNRNQKRARLAFGTKLGMNSPF